MRLSKEADILDFKVHNSHICDYTGSVRLAHKKMLINSLNVILMSQIAEDVRRHI